MNLDLLLKSLPKKKAPAGFTNKVMFRLGLQKQPQFWPVYLPWGILILLIGWLAINFYNSGELEIIKLWVSEGQTLSMELSEWLEFIFGELPIFNLVLVLIFGYLVIKKPKLALPKFGLPTLCF